MKIYINLRVSKTSAADMEVNLEEDTTDCVIYRYGSFATDIEIIGENLYLTTCTLFLCIIDLH